MKTVALIPLLLAALGSTSWGRSLNRQNYFVGEKAAGMGGAMVSLTGDPAVSYYNPAGLAGMFKQGLSLSASAYQMAIEDYPGIIQLELTDGTLNENLKSMVFTTFPSSVAYLLPLDKNEGEHAIHQVLSLSMFIPDYDKVDAKIERTDSTSTFELAGTLWGQEMTYWFGPSYALSFGKRVRLGLSVFGLAHVSERRNNLGAKQTIMSNGREVQLYTASARETSGYTFSLLIQGGVQIQLSDRFSLGATVRSPTLGTLYSSVRMLALSSVYAEDNAGAPLSGVSYVDRIETEDVEMNFRLPLMAAVGIGYESPGAMCFGLDLSFHLPQSSYSTLLGPLVYPKDPQGVEIHDDNRAVDPTKTEQSTWVFNFNLGGEISLTSTWFFRFGAFSDFSAVDQDYYDTSKDLRTAALTMPSLVRFGGSLGLGVIGERTTTFFGLTYVYGHGNTYSLNEIFVDEVSKINVTAHTLTIVVAGSASL